MSEVERIRAEYRRRDREIPAGTYSPTNEAVLFAWQQRARCTLAAFKREHFLPLAGKRILEIGCGSGGWLPLFEDWGARRGDLAGIDLDASRVARAQSRLCAQRDDRGELLAPGADVRCGDAAALPWPDRSFELVVQSTVLTSVLDRKMKQALAAEMARVLTADGIILWYDFRFNNPRNPNVKGIKKAEIAALFPACRITLRRVTLAPPVARLVLRCTWIGALLLEQLRFLNTHYLAIIRKNRSPP